MHGGGGSRGGGFHGGGGGGFRGGGGFHGGPGFRGPMRPPRPHMHFFFGPGWGWGRRYYGIGGCISGIVSILFVLLFIAIILIASLFSAPDITKSTVDREKLPASYVKETYDKWYEDDQYLAITIPVREAEMIKSMKRFYEKTGVQPFVYITDNLDGNYHPRTEDFEAFSKKLYRERFGEDDGGHLILLCVQSDSKNSYSFTIDAEWYVGKDAATVLDSEAHDIFFDYMSLYFDQYYNDTGVTYYEDVFTLTFDKSAERIMGGKTQFWEDWPIGVWIVLVIGVIVVVIIAVSAFGKSKKDVRRDDGTYSGGSDSSRYGYDDRDYSKR